MKDRILYYLDEFANGRKNELADELKKELGLDDQTFQQNSQETQREILHHYSNFSISTIDAFFQKVIRSFTKESGIVGDYRLEVEQDGILQEVIDNLIDELGTNKELTDWVVEFARENLENERAWDVRFSLIDFAKEIFREEFKNIEDDVVNLTSKPGFFRSLKETLWKTKMSFLATVSKPAHEALDIIQQQGWIPDDFKHGKGSGLLTFFKSFAFEKNVGKINPPGARIRSTFIDPMQWPGKTFSDPKTMQRLASDRLVPLLTLIVDHYDKYHEKAFSAEVALKNLYVFGLISDISRKLKEYKEDKNVMLLADAPKFLNGVIQESDTPFIYEKVGSFYRNYLIDEFQDTSGMQWKNFQPLIVNSLDQGHTSLVVGDVKQAIYRWRGGDLGLLQEEIQNQVGVSRTDIRELDSNFRSSKNIVEFNNALFQTASALVTNSTGTQFASSAYHDVSQKVFDKSEGFVQIEFLREPPKTEADLWLNGADPAAAPAKWKEIALSKIASVFEELQSKGAALKDIAILVRKNDEGQQIANFLLQYKNSDKAKEGCRYDVVSNESLRIDGASSVNLILGAMRYLLNGEDAIARAQLGYEYARVHEHSRHLSEVFAVTNQAFFENNLPARFTKEKGMLKKLSVLELTETLIDIFDLEEIHGELTYMQAFEDLVLEFSNRERNDLGAFLEWWEEIKNKKSIQISGEINAAQILTIHKSKGLQFPFVILPFCSWGMDHENWQAPNLWVKSEDNSFKDSGFIPVRYAKHLEGTLFKDYYAGEKTKCYLDNLNLLYVAMTRAKYGMIITAPCLEIRGSKDSVAGLLYNSIKNTPQLNGRFDEGILTFRSNDIHISPNGKQVTFNGIATNRYYTSDWRQKLVIKKTGVEFFDDVSEKRQKINYGIHMHSILSKLNHKNEINDVIERLRLSGNIAADEVGPISNELADLFSIPQVENWFNGGWIAQTEVPVLLPDGKENRFDRLLSKGDEHVVIDFKTGMPKKSDQVQVQEYLDVLRKMNFHSIKGYILYLRDKTILEVKSPGQPKAFRKTVNKDQLGLGF
jgi:ATP-dependent helicase/nuclease subunit A